MADKSEEERYKDMLTGLTDVNRDRANAIINQGLDIKKRAHKLVDIFACSQTLFNPELEDKLDKATKLLQYCKQITPKFTVLLKGAAGLVQTAAEAPPIKKQKLNPESAATSSTGGQIGNITPAPAPSPTEDTPPKTAKTATKPKGGKKKGGGKGTAKKTTLKND